MSNKRYIEINSSYRDRKTWPDPAEFEVSLAESGSQGKLSAKDPVCNSMVVKTWVSNAFDAEGGASILTDGIPPTPAILNTNGNQIIILEFPSSSYILQQEEDYYVGAVVYDADGIRRRILEYKYLGFNGTSHYRGQFVLESSLPEPIDYLLTITDPTDLSISSHLLLFVPDGRESNNAYYNMLMYNETKRTSARIIDYNGVTRIATVDGSNLSVAWEVTDAYSIRAVNPAFTFAFDTSTDTASIFDFPSTALGNYQGDFLRVSNSEATPDNLQTSAPVYETSRVSKYLELNTMFISPSPGGTSAFKLASGSTVDSYYVGGWLHGIAGGPYKVLTYTGATKSGTISGTFDVSVVVGTSAQMRTGFVYPAFTATPSADQIMELLSFTRDNYNPLAYSGSNDSQQNNVCYEIELLNVTLPNRILDSGYGSRISFYPYLYVEFYNGSNPDKNILWSNNPHATRMLFRVPVDDIPNLVTSSFIKLDSDCCVQTVKFRPNDSMHFAVRLGNGELFKTVLEEDFSPSEPNALIQISAIFEIKRVSQV